MRNFLFLRYSPIFSLIHPGTSVPGTLVPGWAGTSGGAPFCSLILPFPHSFILAPRCQVHWCQVGPGHVTTLLFARLSSRFLTHSSWHFGSRYIGARYTGARLGWDTSRRSFLLAYPPVSSLIHPGTSVPGTLVPGWAGTSGGAPFCSLILPFPHSFNLALWFQVHRCQVEEVINRHKKTQLIHPPKGPSNSSCQRMFPSLSSALTSISSGSSFIDFHSKSITLNQILMSSLTAMNFPSYTSPF